MFLFQTNFSSLDPELDSQIMFLCTEAQGWKNPKNAISDGCGSLIWELFGNLNHPDVALWCYKWDGWIRIGSLGGVMLVFLLFLLLTLKTGPHLSFTQSGLNLTSGEKSRYCFWRFTFPACFTSYSIFMDFWAEHNFPAEYECWILFTNLHNSRPN